MGEVFTAESWQQSLAGMVYRSVEALIRQLPAIAGAILVILLGWGVSRIFQIVVRRALQRLGFDRFVARLTLTDSMRRAGVTQDPSAIAGRVVFWMLMLTFLLAATELLGFVALTAIIGQLVGYLPMIAVAALVLVLGFVLGRAANRLTTTGASMVGLPQAERMGKAAHVVVMLIAVTVSAEQLGLKTDALVTLLTILVATLTLTMGLAFALGAGGLVRHILAGHYLRQSLSVGTSIEIGEQRGVIEEIGAVTTVLRNEERNWLVPNAKLLDEVVGR